MARNKRATPSRKKSTERAPRAAGASKAASKPGAAKPGDAAKAGKARNAGDRPPPAPSRRAKPPQASKKAERGTKAAKGANSANGAATAKRSPAGALGSKAARAKAAPPAQGRNGRAAKLERAAEEKPAPEKQRKSAVQRKAAVQRKTAAADERAPAGSAERGSAVKRRASHPPKPPAKARGRRGDAARSPEQEGASQAASGSDRSEAAGRRSKPPRSERAPRRKAKEAAEPAPEAPPEPPISVAPESGEAAEAAADTPDAAVEPEDLADTSAFLKGLVEAILFVSDRPLTLKELARAAKIDKKRASELVAELKQDYAGRGFGVSEVAGGLALRTSAMFANYVRNFLAQRPVRLSRPQLETLAIVAYRQPITRPEIDEIRGVDSGPVLKGLLERDLIKILGKKDEAGRPMLYGTTDAFLELFSMESLRELPTLKEFTELSDESRQVFENQIGEEVPEGGALEFGRGMSDAPPPAEGDASAPETEAPSSDAEAPSSDAEPEPSSDAEPEPSSDAEPEPDTASAAAQAALSVGGDPESTASDDWAPLDDNDNAPS